MRRLDVPATGEEMVWVKVLAGLPAVVAADARNEEKVELSRDRQQEDQGPRRPVVTECESSSTGHFQWLQLCSSMDELCLVVEQAGWLLAGFRALPG
jgi:hypothetical protein